MPPNIFTKIALTFGSPVNILNASTTCTSLTYSFHFVEQGLNSIHPSQKLNTSDFLHNDNIGAIVHIWKWTLLSLVHFQSRKSHWFSMLAICLKRTHLKNAVTHPEVKWRQYLLPIWEHQGQVLSMPKALPHSEEHASLNNQNKCDDGILQQRIFLILMGIKQWSEHFTKVEVCLGLRCVATNIQEICRCATTELDDIHGGHCKAGSIHHTSNFTIQSNVVQVYFCSCNLSQPKEWWFCFTWVYICLFEGQQTQQKRHGQNAGGQTVTLFLKSVMLQQGAKRRW